MDRLRDKRTKEADLARGNRQGRGGRAEKEYVSGRGESRKKVQENTKKKEQAGRGQMGRKQPEESAGAQNMQTAASSGEMVCAVWKKCGGCQYQGLSYAKQLKKKQEQAQKLLKPFGRVLPIIGMEHPYYYRNKVHAVFGRTKSGELVSGTYEAGTHKIVPVEQCLIEDEKCGEIIRSIRGLLKSFKIKTYDEDTGYGLLRHVLVRRGFQSGQIMVVLVLADIILPSQNNFVAALRKLHPDITTIILNVNDKKTSMVLGEREKVLFGPGYIEDTLCGRVFRISSKSFYQVNPVQTEILYRTAVELAGLTGKERVLDAYCGIGTIGLIASDRAREVIGVELNADAIRDARANAKRNGIKNAQFYAADVGDFMVKLADEQKETPLRGSARIVGANGGSVIDAVFMDPPRAGSDEAFLSSLVRLAPEKVVYISCNPETLARDLGYLTGKGYRAERIQPVEMFPWTGHVETVVGLQRVDT